MGSIKLLVMGCAAFASLAAPATAQASAPGEAESLRRLDIMLMVTSLRCRTTVHNFQADYEQFSSKNLSVLNAAARSLQADMEKSSGTTAAKRALDRISVSMANEYGRGHPWLGCSDLKKITQDLAASKSPVQLASAASELLASGPRGQWAMVAAR